MADLTTRLRAAEAQKDTLVIVKILREGRVADVDTVEPPVPLPDLLSAFRGSKIVNEAGNRVILGPVLAGIYELHETVPSEMLQESTVPQLARPDLQAMLAELQKSGRAEERKKSLSFSLLPIEEPSKKKLKLSPSQPCAEDKEIEHANDEVEVDGPVVDFTEMKGLVKIILPSMRRRKLLIRACYRVLRRRINQLLKSGHRYFLITGNPGIGKSAWILYYLATVQHFRNIVIQQTSRFIWFRDGICTILNKDGLSESVIAELDEDDTVLIADSVTPIHCSLPTLMVSSLRSDDIKEWQKLSSAISLYLPCWPKAEMYEASQLEPTYAATEWEELYDKWGGKARPCLDPKGIVQQDELNIDIAITTANILEPVRAIDAAEISDMASHKLLSYVVDDETLQMIDIDWSSPYIKKKVEVEVDRLKWEETQRLFYMAKSSKTEGKSMASTLLEGRMEAHA